MKKALPSSLGSFIWHFLRSYKSIVAIYVGLTLLAGCWGPFNSLLIKDIINLLSSTTPKLHLLLMPAVLLVANFIIFDNFTWRSIDYLNYKYQATIKNKIISEVFDYVLGASHQFFRAI